MTRTAGRDLPDVPKNLETARALLEERNLDALVVTGADRFLNEYTPLDDNHRHALTGFSGSTGFVLLPREGRARLYVDGRYHLQADSETDPALVEVRKISLGGQLRAALLADLRGRVGYEADRTSRSLAESLAEAADEALPLQGDPLRGRLGLPGRRPGGALRFVGDVIGGRRPLEKLEAVFDGLGDPETTALLVSALDDLAWLTDGRARHFRHQSSFAGVGLAVRGALRVGLDEAVPAAGPSAAPEGVIFGAEEPEELAALSLFDRVRRLVFDPAVTSDGLLERVLRARPHWEPVAVELPVARVRALKTAAELRCLEDANLRSSRALARTIRGVRERYARGGAVTEAQLAADIEAAYRAEGADDLSFATIAGVGANGAIIHYGSPSDRVEARPDDLVLLDSGAYYAAGFATDITRTFLAGGRRATPSPRQVRMYTLVLKSLFRGLAAVFPEGSRGSYLDALVRAPLHAEGLDYAHGTGHGVGIHVHESGVSIAPASSLPIRAGQVSSIEPGLYEAGFGGVRHENVVVYEPHPDHPGFLRSRSLVRVAFDENLVDRSLLDAVETRAFDAYQEDCRALGTADLEA